ncbi:hypothetical protein K8I61_10820 [bacterium]|nr:hypothetical protein [bacterium]
MTLCARIARIFAVIAFVAAAAGVQADSFVSVMGFPYGITGSGGINYPVFDEASTQPIFNRIENIFYPVLGMPALVEPGETFKMLVRYRNPDSVRKVTDWRVFLTTAIETEVGREPIGEEVRQKYSLFVEDVTFNWAHFIHEVTLRLPDRLPADTYNIEVETRFFEDMQANAVAVRHPGETFRIVHLTDIDHPSGATGFAASDNSYPWFDPNDEARGIVRQVFREELAFLRPAFAVATGDLTLGNDYNRAAGFVHDEMQQSRTPIFIVPGDRDALAYPAGGEYRTDGVEFYKRIVGPGWFSFDFGGVHFLGLDSADGTRARRTAAMSGTEILADNSGGYVSSLQLDYARKDLANAADRDLPTITFLHHDPRGPYLPNEEPPANEAVTDLPTWQIDGAWDSDPGDDLTDETPGANRGKALLRAFADGRVTAVLLGHTHEDATEHFASGEEIDNALGGPTGVTAGGPIDFVHTTTLAGTVRGEGDSWGYRLMTVRDGAIENADFSGDANLESVPAGNLSIETYGNDGTNTHSLVTVRNALPEPMTGVAVFNLAPTASGYRIADQATGEETAIGQVGVGENGEVVLYVNVTVPEGSDPGTFPNGGGAVVTWEALPLSGNNPPSADIVVTHEGDNVYHLRAANLSDPDGDDVPRVDWVISDGSRFSGVEFTYTHTSGLREDIVLRLTDSHGARGTAVGEVGENTPEIDTVNPPDQGEDEDEGCGGCSASSRGAASGLSSALMVLGVLITWIAVIVRRRRK